MRIFGFAVPLFIVLIGVYCLGAMYPGLYSKARGIVS